MIKLILILFGLEFIWITITGLVRKDLIKTYKSCILCFIFPFLYPRNRFSGLHYSCWTLREFHTNNYKNAVKSKWIKINEEEPKKFCTSDGYRLSLSRDKKSITLFKKQKNIITKQILKSGEIEKIGFDENENNIIIKLKQGSTEIENLVHFISHINDPILYKIILFFDFIEEWILGFFHHIPEFTELDSMPYGWRKSFGYKLCIELWWELFKTNSLYSYRITQIKEKWGSLEWYCTGSKKIYSIIDKYSLLSEKTCIECGKPAFWRTTGYISPYCNDCIDPISKITSKRILQPEEEGKYFSWDGKIYDFITEEEYNFIEIAELNLNKEDFENAIEEQKIQQYWIKKYGINYNNLP